MSLKEREKALVVQILKGDESAFRDLYLSFYKAVVCYIGYYVHDVETSRDLAQETFFYIWENRGKLDPDKGCCSYILSVARSKALNHLRDLKNNRKYSDGIDNHNKSNFNLNNRDKILDNILNKDLLNRVNDEISKLPEKYREVMILSRKKYLTNKEIAQKLDISIKTVEYRLMVTLRQIRKKIDFF